MAENKGTIDAYSIKGAWLSGSAQYVFPELVGGTNPIECAVWNRMRSDRQQRGANEFTQS
jgi:hypothetical protein